MRRLPFFSLEGYGRAIGSIPGDPTIRRCWWTTKPFMLGAAPRECVLVFPREARPDA